LPLPHLSLFSQRQHRQQQQLAIMKAILLFCVLLTAVGNSSLAQTIIVDGKKSDGKLNWSHFSGKVDKSSSYNAHTSYKYNTKMGKVSMLGDSVYIESFDLILYLDQPNSWAKKGKTTDYLLEHEQGHFNIGILCVREIMQRYKAARFTPQNFTLTMQTIMNETAKKYTAMGFQYDRETEHSNNKAEQERWNNFFATELVER
jgi:hypothetical protein